MEYEGLTMSFPERVLKIVHKKDLTSVEKLVSCQNLSIGIGTVSGGYG
jgi:hypothetical protein